MNFVKRGSRYERSFALLDMRQATLTSKRPEVACIQGYHCQSLPGQGRKLDLISSTPLVN